MCRHMPSSCVIEFWILVLIRGTLIFICRNLKVWQKFILVLKRWCQQVMLRSHNQVMHHTSFHPNQYQMSPLSKLRSVLLLSRTNYYLHFICDKLLYHVTFVWYCSMRWKVCYSSNANICVIWSLSIVQIWAYVKLLS